MKIVIVGRWSVMPLRLDSCFQEPNGEGATVGNNLVIILLGIFVEFSSIFCFAK